MGDSDAQPYDIETGGKSISVAWIRERANKNELQLTGHAHKERQEEFIKTKEVREALMKCGILENYPDDPRVMTELLSIRIFRRQSNSCCLWTDEMGFAFDHNCLCTYTT